MTRQAPFKGRYVLGTPYGKRGKYWRCGYHSGVDYLSRGVGGDGVVYPIERGTVEKIGRLGSYGNCVYLRHSGGHLSLYAHLQQVVVKNGQLCELKTPLGIEGSTGNSTGRHLHLEVHRGSYKYPSDIDPVAFIAQKEEEKMALKQLEIELDGKTAHLEAVEFNGNNYVLLRGLAELVGVGVEWDAAKKRPVLHTARR